MENDSRIPLFFYADETAADCNSGPMSILWTQKVERFLSTNTCRENVA